MKKYLIIIVLFSRAFCQQPDAFLSVNSQLASLPVYLDSVRIGVTPLQDYAIRPGTHVLIVPSPYGLAWNEPGYVQSFSAEAGQEYKFEPVFTKNIFINSIPYGAHVIVDDKLQGCTPLTISALPQIIRIEKEGYEPQDIDVTQVQGTSLTMKLKPLQSWLLANQQKQHAHERKIKWRKRFMWGSMALAAAAGYATIYYHNQGNDAYSRYLTAALPEDMNRYYDRAHRYDKYAGWYYTLFEMGFVLTGYFFLGSRE
jgi:hypothetical protein